VTLGFCNKLVFLGALDGTCVGKLWIEDFGLPEAAIAEGNGVALIPKIEELTLPPIVSIPPQIRKRVVVGFGGCKELMAR